MSSLVLREETTSTASEDFKKNRINGFRYVDKTPLLVPLLNGDHETTFFLRPRRFGKTLTLSMIHYFVEDTRDEELNEENRSLFQGLKIMEMGEKYTRQMTSYSVIHLTMQTVSGLDFQEAVQSLTHLLQKAYQEKSWLLKSAELDQLDRLYFQRVYLGQDETGRKCDLGDLKTALQNLTMYLRKATGRRAVVLIDEYDVPLEKAYRNGYYREMVNVIGPLMQNVLKTNSANLQFAVVTGCLRIAKEGIYTGLNNPDVNTVLTPGKNDAIGFTDTEVRKLLADSGFPDRYGECAEWYDGYRYGTEQIYNPWSVIKYIEDLQRDPDVKPGLHWAGTSSNSIVRDLAEHAREGTLKKAERLVQGEEITFSYRDDIVYDELYENEDNLFNVMLATGYLTATGMNGRTIHARIPNREIQEIYREKYAQWFRESLKTFNVQELYSAMEAGNTEKIEDLLNDRFLASMSYYDTVEAFYHGVMLSLMQLNTAYICRSNREAGQGRFDLMCKQRTRWHTAFVMEFKVSRKPGDMLRDAERAANQIGEKQYIQDLREEGYRKIYSYGFAFCEKRCRVCPGQTWEL